MLAQLLCPLALAALPLLETETARRLANPWAGWVTGSWVTLQIENTLTGGMTSKQSLVEAGSATYTLRDETEWEDGSSDKQVVMSLARFGYPHSLPEGQVVATETVTVEGRAFECEVWRARFTEDGQTWDSIAWVSPELDQPLRIRSKAKMSVELEVKKLEDFITVARRKFRCVRYEGHITAEGKRSPVTQWRSSEIPGGVAKSVTTFNLPQGKVTHTTQVTAFRGTRIK